MSLKHLNSRISKCRQDMDLQRDAIVTLVSSQKSVIDREAKRIPLPVAIGGAMVAGFVAERFFRSPSSSQLFRAYMMWRAF